MLHCVPDLITSNRNHDIALRYKYFLQHPALKHPQFKFYLILTGHVSHPYKTSCKILIFDYLRKEWIDNIV